MKRYVLLLVSLSVAVHGYSQEDPRSYVQELRQNLDRLRIRHINAQTPMERDLLQREIIKTERQIKKVKKQFDTGNID